MNELTTVPISLADLKTIIEEIFEERSRIGSEFHGKHHEWIEARITAEKAKKELYRDMAKWAIQWSVTGILGGVVYWVKNNIHLTH